MKYFFTAFFLLFSSFSFASDNTPRVIGIEVNENTSRDELRSKVNGAGAVVIREDDQYWMDRYNINAIVKNGDILELTYSIRTKKLADVKIFFKGNMSPHYAIALYEKLEKIFGVPSQYNNVKDHRQELFRSFNTRWQSDKQHARIVGTVKKGIVVNFLFASNKAILDAEVDESNRLKKLRESRQVNNVF